MSNSKRYKKLLLHLIPTIGIFAFFILYFISTLYYPGGSYAERDAEGFSWMHNYWCNLLDRESLNGEINNARPWAITATACLCFGIGCFYYLFPKYFEMRKLWKIFIRFVGVLSMCFAIFIFTVYHDQLLNIAGICGGAAFLGTLVALRRNHHFKLLWFGAFSFSLIGVNNYMYYTDVLIEYLPAFQKFSMIVVLLWFVLTNIAFVRSTDYSSN